ncbi:MAG TPA: hypothetical protein VD978_12170 [Azospirillum sp.]|nr:hypothetical protein [Azospirillum sp.]
MAVSKAPRAGITPTRLSAYLAKQIDALSGIKSQRQIANELGYDKGNIISMFKTGEAKFPLHKLPALARSLNIDLAFLVRLGVEQYFADDKEGWKELSKTLDRLVSENEMEFVGYLRDISGNTDPHLDEDMRAAIAEAYARRKGGA